MAITATAVQRRENLPTAFSAWQQPSRTTASGTSAKNSQVRWYLVHTPRGQEQSTCNKVKKLIDPHLLTDAFVIQREYWFKSQGTWQLQIKPLYPEYFFVATADAPKLDRALAGLSLHVRIAGSVQSTYQPMAPQAQAWFESVLDQDHVLRNSIATITGGVLSIQAGPLVGQEDRVRKIDRRKRWCRVLVGEGDAAFSEVLPLDVPIKN